MSAKIKPYGWEVDVLVSDRLVQVEANSTRHTLRYRGSESAARTRALCRKHVWKIVEVRAIDEPQWIIAHGRPWERKA